MHLLQRIWIGLRQLSWHALARFFALSASAASLGLYALHPALLERIDALARDLVFVLRPAPAPSQQVVIVAIDEAAAKEFGHWPWPRSLQGELIASIKDLGAATIALDIVYVNPQSSEQDAALAEGLAAPGARVIGGYFFRGQQSSPPASAALDLVQASRIKVVSAGHQGNTRRVREFPFVEVNHADLAERFESFGFFNYLPDADGVLRSAAMVLRYRDKLYPSLSLKALSHYLGIKPVVKLDNQGVADLQLGDRHIPVDREGKLALNFYRWDRPIPIVSAAAILNSRVAADAVKGRMVFVGVAEACAADLVPTPVDDRFPRVATHATAAGNVLQDFHLYHDIRTTFADVALIGVTPLLMVSLLAYIRSVFGRLVVLAAIGGGVSLFFYTAIQQGFLISLVYPMLSVGLGFLLYQAYFMAVVQRQVRFLRTAFSSYVSPALVHQLISHPDALTLKGERRNVSVLFSDIRRFTTISETIPPERLVPILNLYLGPMTEIVMEEYGTLDKYIGDAVMALYNAPLDVPDHPVRAAHSALRMLEKLAELNVQFLKSFDLTLNIGIGIHTGVASVGNMGSAQRFDYTAIGDTVNLASRLEGRTKVYGVNIVISESTRAGLDDSFCCRRLDRIQVKGKSKPVQIYELLPRCDKSSRDLARRFDTALSLYFAADFEQARTLFAGILVDFPADGPAEIFVQRCEQYLRNPPGAGWQGVYVAKNK
jgi:adenylate cyclase